MIEFIDDPSISSPQNPVFALLISRETYSDPAGTHDDNTLPEERRGMREERERERTRRQVEADLGGFDVEQEWVEEIEREECFEADEGFGGAPPVPDRKYELWVRYCKKLLKIVT